MTVIDTPEGMAFFRLLQFEGRLKLETETRLTFRQPTLKTYNLVYGTNFTRKTAALEDCRARIQEAKVLKWAAEVTDVARTLLRQNFGDGVVPEEVRTLVINHIIDEGVDEDMREPVRAWFAQSREVEA